MSAQKLILSKTPTGKPKLTDSQGFSIANSPDGTRESHANFERLLLCWQALENFPTEYLKQVVESQNFEFQIIEK